MHCHKPAIAETRMKAVGFWAVMLVIAGGYAYWRYRCIVSFGWHDDEGSFLFAALWLSKGKQLYSNVHILQYPLFLEWLGLAFRVAPPVMLTGRLVVIALSALYIIVVGLIGRRISSVLGGVVAGMVLLLDLELFDVSGFVLAEVPSLFFAALCVLFGVLYLERGRRVHLAAASFLCAVSLLTKPSGFLMPVWIAALVLMVTFVRPGLRTRPGVVEFAKDASIALGCFGAPTAAAFLLYGPQTLLDVSFTVRAVLREASSWSVTTSWPAISTYFAGSRAALIVACSSLLTCNVRDWRRSGSTAVSIWLLFLLTLIGLWWFAPLRHKNCVVLSLPIALLGGMSVAALARRDHPRWASLRGVLALTLVASAMAVAVFDLPGQIDWRTSPDKSGRQVDPDEAKARQVLNKISMAGEIIVTDEMGLAFYSGRWLPPELSDVSNARIDARDLTDADMIDAVQRYDVQTTVFWLRKLDRLEEFNRWAKEHFVSEQRFGASKRILHGRRYENLAAVPGQRLTPAASFGDSVALVGYRFEPEVVLPGDVDRLILYWECRKPITQTLRVSTQVLGADGAVVAEADDAPVSDRYPSTQWRPGEVVADIHRLSPPFSVASGQYEVLVSLYDVQSTQRLPVHLGSSTADVVRIGAMKVASP